MVDFNSDGAFATNRSHILELVILGRRDELINAFQSWRENMMLENSKELTSKFKLRSCMFALYLELEPSLKRRWDASVYNKFRDSIISIKSDLDNDVILEMFFKLNNALDEMNLIKIDKVKTYDSRKVEGENEAKGL